MDLTTHSNVVAQVCAFSYTRTHVKATPFALLGQPAMVRSGLDAMAAP